MARRLLIPFLLLALVAAVGAGPASAAKKRPAYKSAVFMVDLRGTQVSTWEYHVDTLKDDPCGSKIDAYGDQTLRFATSKATRGKMIVGQRGNRTPTMTVVGDTKTFTPWEFSGTADRNGTRISDLGNNRGKCGDNGGGVRPGGREDKQCGERHGWFEAKLYPTRRRVRLEGDSRNWATHPLATVDFDGGRGDYLDATYEDCPFWEGGPAAPEAEAGFLPAPEKLPLAKIFSKRKTVTIDFGKTKNYATPKFKGRTIITGKLTLRRTTLAKAFPETAAG